MLEKRLIRDVSPTPRGIRLGVQAARVVFPAADRAEIAAAADEILSSGILTLGPYTRQFEAAFGAAHSGSADHVADAPHAVAVSSAAAALGAGARLVFADIDPATFALSPETLNAALTPQTAAVVLVHVGGLI